MKNQKPVRKKVRKVPSQFLFHRALLLYIILKVLNAIEFLQLYTRAEDKIVRLKVQSQIPF